MDNDTVLTEWLRMWNEDPALAHELMTDDCVQWSNRLPGLDSVVGPAEQERFVTDYQTRTHNVFTPRVFVDTGDRFAYLWDVRDSDGRVRTGLDVNTMRDNRIHENWTFVGTRCCAQPDPEPGTTAEIEDLVHRWTQLRNGRAELAADVVTPDFTLFSGETPTGDLTGPDELAAMIERRAGPAFTVHRQPLVDPTRGTATFLWTAATPTDGIAVGGVDLLATHAGRITHAWTLTGTRAFRY